MDFLADSAFGLALKSTRFGLSVARKVTGTVATLSGTILDQTFSLSAPQSAFLSGPTSTFLRSTSESTFDLIDYLTLTPLVLSQKIASSIFTTKEAEPSFTLAAFVQLVRREMDDPAQRVDGVDHTFTGVLHSLAAWVGLQSSTAAWGDGRMMSGLREVNVRKEWVGLNQDLLPGEESVPLPSVFFETDQIIDGTEETTTSTLLGDTLTATVLTGSVGTKHPLPTDRSTPPPTETDRASFRADVLRFSKICLGSYGGSGLMFFGLQVPVPPEGAEGKAKPGFWDTVRGKHDQTICKFLVLSFVRLSLVLK